MKARSLLCAILAALAVAPVPARADGDPASDVLLGQNVFYPYQPPVAADLQKALDAETAVAARVHFPIKVALIASPVDLGVITQLFGKPQQYARFLDQEISYPSPQPLLVVMAAGYGVAGLPPAARTAVASLRPPAGRTTDDLAQAALIAVRTMAKAAGHPVPAAAGSGGGGSAAPYIAAGVALAAVTIAAALIVSRRGVRPAIRTARRRRRTHGTDR